MIRILIADDEKLIRAGLIKTIKDSFSLPMEFFEAKNGKEALDLIKAKEPAVLITDIKMPVMDGIGLMGSLEGVRNKPQIIVLSGFDDFSFAKAAIQSGALTYILKPVDRKELVVAINQAIEIHARSEKKHTEEMLKSVMDEGIPSIRQEDIGFDFARGAYYASVYGAGCAQAAATVLTSHRYYVMEEKHDYVELLYSYAGSDVHIPDGLLDGVLIGVSGQGTNFSQLKSMRKQSVIALLQGFFDEQTGLPLGRRRRGLFHFDKRNEPEDFDDIDEKYSKLSNTLERSESKEIQKNVRSFLSFPEGSALSNAKRLHFIHGKLVSDLFARYDSLIEGDIYLPSKVLMVEDYASHPNLDSWCSCVMDVLIYLGAVLKHDTEEYPYIAEAIGYMKKHYNKNINMAMVANQVSVNYTWFSQKFKEHTGLSFNNYLKGLRIDEAKRLLQKNCYKVYEVADKVGFADVKYFMKVFRASTGISASEWAAKHAE